MRVAGVFPRIRRGGPRRRNPDSRVQLVWCAPTLLHGEPLISSPIVLPPLLRRRDELRGHRRVRRDAVAELDGEFLPADENGSRSTRRGRCRRSSRRRGACWLSECARSNQPPQPASSDSDMGRFGMAGAKDGDSDPDSTLIWRKCRGQISGRARATNLHELCRLEAASPGLEPIFAPAIPKASHV